MDQQRITWTLLGMMAVTYLPRFVPLWLFSSRPLPGPVAAAWMRHIPVAVLAAMLLPSLLLVDGRIVLGLDNLFLWAALPTTVVAFRTRSFFGSVAVGVAIVAAARLLLAL